MRNHLLMIVGLILAFVGSYFLLTLEKNEKLSYVETAVIEYDWFIASRLISINVRLTSR